MSIFDNFPFRNSDGRTSLASLSVRHIITPRRAGITIASAFACVGIASAMSAGATTGSTDGQAKQDHTVQLKLEKKNSTESSTQLNASDSTPAPQPEQHSQSQSNVSFQQHISSNAGDTPTTTHHVTVNGKEVPVPASGTVKKVITDKDGSTSVHITTNTNSSANNSSSSSISVNVSSDTSSSSSSDSDVTP